MQELKGENLQVVDISEPHEPLGLDYGLISGLFRKLPEKEASAILFKLIEDIIHSISQAEQDYYCAENKEFSTALNPIRSSSNRVGFMRLACVASDAQLALDHGDRIALSAIVLRLLRVGEQSLDAIWDGQFQHY